MAKNTQQILDPSTSGVGGLRGLDGLNRLREKGINVDPTIFNLANDYKGTMAVINQSATPLNIGFVGINDSMFDKNITSASQLEDLNNTRGELLPWYAQLSAGIAKGVILAGTTFLDGTIGLVFGLGLGFYNLGDDNKDTGFWSGLWDNDFSKAMKSINDASEEFLPNYYTNDELNDPWYQHILSANFIGDKFLKNIGFTVGAFYSGAVWSLPLLAGRFASFVNRLAQTSKAAPMVTSTIGATISAINEGRIEALNNSTEWYNKNKTLLEGLYLSRKDAILKSFIDAGDISPEAIAAMLDALKNEDDSYKAAMARLESDRIHMGNVDMMLNLPILLASNIVLFGKLYANGYKTARKANNIILKGKFKGMGYEQAKRQALSEGMTAELFAKEFGLFAAGKSSVAKALLADPLAEGSEELLLGLASKISGNYYGDDVHNYYKLYTDPDATVETTSWMKAIAEGINETINDGSSWEEFFIGALTGALGMPSFRSAKSSDGSFRSPITIERGILGELKDRKEKMARDKEIADYLNSRIQSPDFLNYYQGLIRHNSLLSVMNQAAEDGNERAFKDAEFAQLMSDITMFDNAGKLEDLKSMIGTAFDTSDENLDSIIRNTTSVSQDGNLVGPFAQFASLQDGKIVSNIGNEEGKKKMIELLTKNKDDMMGAIDAYQEIKDEIDVQTQERLSDEQLEELIYLLGQIHNWEQRQEDMFLKLKEGILRETTYSEAYEDLIKLSLSTIHGNNKRAKEAQKRIDKAKRLVELLDKITKSKSAKKFFRSINKSDMVDLNELIADSEFIRPSEKLALLQIARDSFDIAQTSNLYGEKLKEFLANPEKQLKELNLIKKDNEEKRKKADKKTKADRYDNMSERDLANSMMEGEDLSEFDDLFDIPDDTSEAERAVAEDRKRKKEAAESKVATVGALVGGNQPSIIDRVEGSEQAKADAKKLVKKSAEVSETEDEMLDLEREIFADPSVLMEGDETMRALAEQGATSEELEAFAQLRMDDALEVLGLSFAELEKAEKELADLPKDAPVARTLGNEAKDDSVGHDDTSKGTTAPPVATESKADETKPKEDKPEEPEPPTPPSLNPPLVATQARETEAAVNDSNGTEASYWKPTTSRYPFGYILLLAFNLLKGKTIDGFTYPTDFNEFRKIPFYLMAKHMKQADGSPRYTEKLLKRMEAVYKYLEREGAFERRDNGLVQPGDKIGFMIDPKLNEEAGDIVILMVDKDGNVIGDVMPKEAFPSSSADRDLLDTIESIEKEYEATSKDKAFVSSLNTTASKVMVGQAPFTAERNSLNRVAGTRNSDGTVSEGTPLLGIARTSGSGATITMEPGGRMDERSDRERAVISPVSTAAGTVFYMLETGNKNRRYLPIPISIPLYGLARDSLLGKLVDSIIERINSISTPKEARELKDELREVISVKDMFIETDSNGNVKLLIKPYNSNQWITIYNGVNDANAIAAIKEGLGKCPFLISRKYINGKYKDGRDYNLMIGEIATVNLPEATTRTLNEWFTANPIKGGKPLKAKNPKTTGVNPRRSSSKTIGILSGNGETYYVDIDTWEVTDKDGNILPEHPALNAFRAAAYGRKKGLSGTYETRWGTYDSKKGNWVTKKLSSEPDAGISADELASMEAEMDDSIDLNELDEMFASMGDRSELDEAAELKKQKDKERAEKEKEPSESTWESGFRIITAPEALSELFPEELDNNFVVISTTSSNEESGYRYVGTSSDSKVNSWWNGADKELTEKLGSREKGWVETDGHYVYVIRKAGREGSYVAIAFKGSILDKDKAKIEAAIETIDGKITPQKFQLSLKEILNGKETTTQRENPTKVKSDYPIYSNEEADKRAKDNRLISKNREGKREKAWAKLTNVQKSKILSYPKARLKALLDALEKAYSLKDKSFNETLLKGTVDMFLGIDTLNRETRPGTKKETRREKASRITKEEREWFDKNLPLLSNPLRLLLVERILGMSGDRTFEAWGLFKDGIIYLSTTAAKGTLYHEAFHAVVHTLLSDEEYGRLFEAARLKYGDRTTLSLEETLAEEFRRYMLYNERSPFQRFFNKLKHFIKSLFGRESAIDNLFYRISSGNFADRVAHESNETRYSTNWALEEAKRIYFDEVWRYELSDRDIRDINRKLRALSDRIGDVPWHLRPTSKGGWYIAGYNNRGVTFDDYYSPLIRNHYRKAEIRQYGKDKLQPRNLSKEQLDYLTERKVPIEEYKNWSNAARELFFRCM